MGCSSGEVTLHEIHDQAETRAVWINEPGSPATNDQSILIELIKKANLNTVFIPAPLIENTNGINYGHVGEDSFAAFATALKAQGLCIIPVLGNFTRQGAGTQADFTSVAEQTAQAEWVMSLMAKYASIVDGIQLDYIRYASYHEVNQDAHLDGVTAAVRAMYTAFKAVYPTKVFTATCFPANSQFLEGYSPSPQWVEDVPDWFRNWYIANSGTQYHGGVVAGLSYTGVPSFMKFQQDPITWISSNIVDAVFPMEYSMYDDVWNRNLGSFKSMVEYTGSNATRINMGLGYFYSPDSNGEIGLGVSSVVRKIKYARAQGLTGFAIFKVAGNDTGDPQRNDQALIEGLTQPSELNNFDPPFLKAVPSKLCSN